MTGKAKERKPAEESLFLRMLWFALTFTCFNLIALVDLNITQVTIYDFKVPLILVYFFVALLGSGASYYYRHKDARWLEIPGLICVGMTCVWFVDNLKNQLTGGGEIDLLLPTALLVAGMYASHSFELRTRFDFNFSLAVSLIIVCFAAALGKGAGFGVGMFVYVVLAATLLLLDCEARTFGIVQARDFESGRTCLTFNSRGGSEKTANLVVPTFALLLLSICFFQTVPRAESLADQVAARVYAFIKHKNARDKNAPEKPAPTLARRVRSPFRTPRLASLDATPAQTDRTQSPDKFNQKKAARVSAGKNAGHNLKAERKEGTSARIAGSGRQHHQYSRLAEKARREREEKSAKSGTDNPSSFNEENTAAAAGIDKECQSKTDSQKAAGQETASKKAGQAGAGERGTTSGTHAQPDSTTPDNETNQGTGQAGQKLKQAARPALKKTGAARPLATSFNLPDTLDTTLPANTEDIPIFSVACNRTVCYRQGAFDRYDGHSWQVSGNLAHVELERGPGGRFALREFSSLALPEKLPAIRMTQKFRMLRNLGDKIIFAGSPSEVAFPGPSLKLDACDNLKASWALVDGLEYSVYADEPMYDLKAMRLEGVPSEAAERDLRLRFARLLQIPDQQSEELYDLSRQIAGLDDNWFVQAEKICSYLRHKYKYSNDPEYKVERANSADHFLFDSKTGDCKDFAGAFVLLCRASGIPARMVVGFTEGDFDPVTGTRIIKLKNSHAWGEVYCPSAGWVPFDPTPQGIMPAKQKEEERYFTTLGQNVESSIKKAQVDGKELSGSRPRLQVPMPNGSVLTIVVDFWQILTFSPFLLAALVVSGPLFMCAAGLLKKIAWPKKIHPASKIYLKAVRDLKSIGVASPESQTPGEFLFKIKEKLSLANDPEQSSQLAQAVEDFVSCYNATFFGSHGLASDLEAKRLKIKELIKD